MLGIVEKTGLLILTNFLPTLEQAGGIPLGIPNLHPFGITLCQLSYIFPNSNFPKIFSRFFSIKDKII